MDSSDFQSPLHGGNIESQVERYVALIAEMGSGIAGLKGLPLLSALKRQKVEIGPYGHVSLFEAANRIMTDLVLLYGIRWLLASRTFPFSKYEIEYGHGNKQPFDIMAEEGGVTLIGEAFNVAPSLFKGKKTSMLEKLRTKRNGAT